MKRIALLIPAAAMVLAGCSSSAQTSTGPSHAATSSAATSSAHPSPTPSPTPTIWTLKQAAAEYLRLVAPGNKLIAAYAKLPSNAPVEQWRSLGVQIAAADDVFARGLVAGKWPAEVQPQIKALTPAVLKERIGFQYMGQAKTIADVQAAVNLQATANQESSAAATAVRIALGLPSN